MIKLPIYQCDTFDDGKVLHNKKKNNLTAMGWNSWNAFGSGNTEALTKCMADALVALGLDKLGYKYVVLDDGCYKPERVDGADLCDLSVWTKAQTPILSFRSVPGEYGPGHNSFFCDRDGDWWIAYHGVTSFEERVISDGIRKIRFDEKYGPRFV